MVQTCIWFKEGPSQFSMGQIAQSLTCSIMEKPHTELDDCLRMLQACCRKRMSVPELDGLVEPVQSAVPKVEDGLVVAEDGGLGEEVSGEDVSREDFVWQLGGNSSASF